MGRGWVIIPLFLFTSMGEGGENFVNYLIKGKAELSRLRVAREGVFSISIT
jgi:hypothetical protein